MEPKKILFANVPADGHFNPLTGIAVHLLNQGHDVRWYTGKMFEAKILKYGIPFFPFKKALEVNQFNVHEIFPERNKIKAGVERLKFDLKHLFVYRSPECFEDIQEIRKSFRFDVMVCDCAFTAAPFVKDKMKISVVSIGIIPLMATSKDLPPYGMGLIPDYTFLGRIKQNILRFFARNILFNESTFEFNRIANSYGLDSYKHLLFDIPIRRSDVFLQTGVPGLEYERSDLPATVKFVGPLHAATTNKYPTEYSWFYKLSQFQKIILITQGTVESDPSKLIIPSLDALKHAPYLLIVATGGHNTEALRIQYPEDNVVIEDFIDFKSIMPKVDLYITNGGFGGALSAIEHALPMVVAGINEGKNEICARIGYKMIGINLNTEKPMPESIQQAAEKIFYNRIYKKNIEKLRDEFKKYDTNALCERYILETIQAVEMREVEKLENQTLTESGS